MSVLAMNSPKAVGYMLDARAHIARARVNLRAAAEVSESEQVSKDAEACQRMLAKLDRDLQELEEMA